MTKRVWWHDRGCGEYCTAIDNLYWAASANSDQFVEMIHSSGGRVMGVYDDSPGLIERLDKICDDCTVEYIEFDDADYLQFQLTYGGLYGTSEIRA